MIEPLYHQTIAGKKTMTRRSGGLDAVNVDPDFWELVRFNETHAKFWKKFNATEEVYCKPRYKVGEVLYIKEPISIRYIKKETNDWETLYKYGKTVNGWPTKSGIFAIPEVHGLNEPIWENKLFMPAKAARAFIRITGIKCERLFDISDEDCIAEGINGNEGVWKNYLKGLNNYPYFMSAKHSFISLYKFANKVKEVPNIWCWCYTFEYLPNYTISQPL